MKRIGHLFEQAFSPPALLAAYRAAARHKSGRRACFAFERRLASSLDALHAEVHAGTYAPRPYHRFVVREPKERTIFAPAFRDLVVQHAIYALIAPIFDRVFIAESFACRKGFGTHAAADYAQSVLRSSRSGSYTLKLDVRKFFYRIDRTILRARIERKIKDRRFVDMMMLFADYGEPVGIPIGNLLSQVYALIYLDPVDQFIKRTLKVRRYCRYVDDLMLFDLTRAQALEYRTSIEHFLRDECHLEYSRTSIARTRRGINFVGYRTWASRRFIRKHSLYRFRRAALTGAIESVVSFLGHARRTASHGHMLDFIRSRNHDLYRRLPESHRRHDDLRAARDTR